ncbi:MAG TPA: hypothetical protein VH592_00170 [Gemmataceae bacterium]
MIRGLLVFTALFLTCITLSADWLFDGSSLSDRLNDCMTLLDAYRKKEQLASDANSTFERLQVKSRIAQALRNGEMRLIDAAAYFRSLHEDPRSWCYPNRPRPEHKDVEGWCRLVIEWTMRNNSSEIPSSQVEALHQRLETELQNSSAAAASR